MTCRLCLSERDTLLSLWVSVLSGLSRWRDPGPVPQSASRATSVGFPPPTWTWPLGIDRWLQTGSPWPERAQVAREASVAPQGPGIEQTPVWKILPLVVMAAGLGWGLFPKRAPQGYHF